MKKKVAVVSFGITVVMFIIVAILRNIYPFGTNSLLVFDMSQQYVEFFGYLRHVLMGETSWNYSFVQSLGGDSIGLFAYYLMSPYNLILLCFEKNLTFGVFIITMLKIASASTTMAVFLANGNHRMDVIPFAVSYGFMSYVIIYASNIMWLDGVIALPLVILGLKNFLEKKKLSILYCLALCYSLVTNFYMGYMICIASVLYFIYWQIRNCKSRQSFLQDILHFAVQSIIGAGIGAWLLVPFAMAMEGTKSQISISSLFTLEKIHTIKECLEKIFIGSWITSDVLSGAPIIYCGTAVILLFVCYFLNYKIPKRAKLAAVFFIFCVGISEISKSVDLIWHVFNAPNCYPGRYAFVISFALISLAYECFRNWNKKVMLIAIVAGSVYLGTAFLWRNSERISVENVAIMVGATIAVLGILTLVKNTKAVWICLLCLIMADGIYNADIEMARLPYDSENDFSTYYAETDQAVNVVKQMDTGAYRLEKDFLRGNGEYIYNDSYLFMYPGISCFSSTTKDSLKELMGKLGYRQNYLKIVYGNGSTEFADSLLGIKYFLSRKELEGLNKIEKSGSINIYENPYALGIVTQNLSSAIVQTNVTETDTFAYQNKIFAALTGRKKDLLNQITAEVTSMQNLQEKNGRINKINDNEMGSVTYEITAEQSGYIYYRVEGEVGTADIRVNGESLREYYAQNQWNIGKLYADKKGQKLSVSVEIDSGACDLADLVFYQQDQELYQNEMTRLKNQSAKLELKKSNDLSFDASADEDGNWVLLTIPYDEKWNCYVDGEKTEIKSVLGGLTGISLEKGQHHIEMKYPVKGMWIGGIISIISLIGLVFIWKNQMFKEKSFFQTAEK